jgi:hypothetical protein
MFTLIWLIGWMLLFCVTLREKCKSNVKSIYFQKIIALNKLKQVKNTKNRHKLFLKYVMIKT